MVGSTASTISGSSTMVLGISNLADTSTTFDVAGVTGNSTSDLNVSVGLNNGFNTDRNKGLIKTGVGTMTLSGTNSYTGTTTVSAGTLSAGNIVVSAGSSNLGNATSAVTLGAASTQGTLSYTGNNATYTRGFTIGGAGGGRLDVTTSGQTLQVSTGNVTGSGLFTVGGAGNTTINANLTHTGGLTKADAGTLTLSGTNSYTGASTVSAGTLLVNGSLGDAAVTVANGATLGGSGTVGTSTVLNTFTVNGTLAPGNSPGILTINDNLDLNGTLSVELKGTTAGTGHDQLGINGAVDISGSTLIALFDTFTPVNGNLLFILLNDGSDAITGTFSGLAQNAIVANYGGFDWKISYNADSTANTFTGTANGNDIALMAVPEPRAALLGGLGLLCLLRRRRP